MQVKYNMLCIKCIVVSGLRRILHTNSKELEEYVLCLRDAHLKYTSVEAGDDSSRQVTIFIIS